MNRFITLTTLFLGLALVACRADLSDLQVVQVAELAEWSADGADVTICDANSEDTRTRYGVIPGAVLLSSYRDYDPAAELPSDKGRRLVFYCHSEMCGAAGDAARVARDAGYRDIWVMAPGIRGWARAGRPVHPAPGAES
jgi:rhodanese-related sulfurtransferase